MAGGAKSKEIQEQFNAADVLARHRYDMPAAFCAIRTATADAARESNMIEKRAYLDWNATAPLRPQARAAMVAALDAAGNPSSIHAEGRAARRIVEAARADVAALFGADPSHVTFTSGGTEANALALTPQFRRGAADVICERLLLSGVEHPSVRTGGRFTLERIEIIPVDGNGVIDLGWLADRLCRDKAAAPALVSVMAANNETGVIQPISEVSDLVHEAGGVLHVDAVQAAGRIPFDINALQIDFMTVSAHKIGGPKGVGALIRGRSDLHLMGPLVTGGGQERGQRAGTENVAGIAGFGAAATAAREAFTAENAHVQALRDRLEAGLRAQTPAVIIFGEAVPRLPNTTLFALPGVKAETAVIAFDLEDVAVSSGAACSSGKVQPSAVLQAMGVEGGLTRSGLRVSLGWDTTEADIEMFLNAWLKVSRSLHKGSSGRAA